jgi:predicted N-acetyltransferase YhbS
LVAAVVIRELRREDLPGIWNIDRREVIDNVYYIVGGRLLLQPEHWDVPGWSPGEQERYTPILRDCFDRGGAFYGAFEGSDLVGVAVLESRFMGPDEDQLQLKFLHVSQSYRREGWGKALFEKAADRAQDMGARRLYISATPSQNTVDFYRHLGCVLTDLADPELLALEPEDIHLEYVLSQVSPARCCAPRASGDCRRDLGGVPVADR